MGWSFQGPTRLGLLILLTVFFTDARECKISCHGTSGNTLRFEPGKVYNYKLDGQSVTTVTGAVGEASKLAITADVQVAALSSCEHVLKVTNVQTSGQDGKKHSLSKLSQQPVKFGLQNGNIGSELCVTDAEDSVGLNIKRAVLSMIQSSVLKDSGHASQTETDIFGSCPTGFEFSKSGGTLTIVKDRDLNKCGHREDITMPFLTTPYYLKSDFQASPILVSSFKSEQKIEGGILKSAKLEEHYQYKPGATPEAISKIAVKTQLSFVNSAPGAIPAACTVPRSIIFEQEHTQEGHGISNKIVDLVRQGCDSRSIEENTAEKFSKLIKTIAIASKTDINQALQHVKSGPGIKDRNTAQRMLLDAIVMAQSGSSVEIMADILKKKEVSGNTARMWLLGLGAVKHATKSSLTAVLPLLDGEHPDVNAYLGIGSLAGKFCQEHSCDGVNEINQLQIKLGAPLLKGCKVGTVKEEDQIIASLKGLGNVKYLSPKIAGKIAECAADENVCPRIRVAALETIATDAHKDQFKTLALNILKNVNEDSELRIKAYLVLVKCPCGKVAAAVKDLLANEQSNQVGGYIVSHLRNLHASTNPDKAAAKHHLGNIIPPHRFIIDPHRYSVNQELSYSNGLINSGGSGEVDIIYSQNSYIPRSINLNLTSQIFGTAYNLLELDLRVENIERVAEAIFGPRGYLHSHKAEDFVVHGQQEFSEVLEEIAARYEKTLRPKRSISRDQLDNIANKVHLPHSSDNIDLDFSMKFLGSEVAWSHMHGLDSLRLDNRKVVNGYFDSVDSFIHSLKNSDVDYRRHFTFLDRDVTYPTGLGLALRLTALGTAALRVKLDGKIDIPAIIRDPTNTDIRFQLIPSAAINIGGEIVIDGVAVETGVRMDLNVHTSTGSDVAFRLLDGHGVDVKVGMPLPKQEIFTLKTHFNSISRDDTHSVSSSPIKYETPIETYEGCFDQLSAISGLTFCGVISGPYEEGKPLIPFYGPVSLAVSINKEDKSLSSYHFKAYYNRNEDNVHSVELLLDTPNSNTNRKLSFTLDGAIKSPKKFISAKFNSPWTTASLSGNVVNTKQENSFDVKFIHDGTEYSARLGAKNVRLSPNKIKYEPIFEYKAPEPTRSALIGKKGGPKPKTQLISSSGSVLVETSNKEDKYTFQSLALTTPKTTYTLDGTLVNGPAYLNSDLKVSYEKDHVSVKGKVKYGGRQVEGHVEITPSEYPDLGISADIESYEDANKYDIKLILVHGPDPKSEVSRIYIRSNFILSGKNIYIGSKKIPEFSTLHEIKYPVVQLDASAKATVTNKEVSAGLKGKLDKYSAKFECGVRGDIKKDFEANLDTEFMGQELKLLTTCTPEGKTKSRINNVLILKPGGTYQLNALVNYDVGENVDFSIDADGSIPNKSAFKLSAAYQLNPTKLNNKIKFHLGEKCFVDYTLLVNRGNTPNGNFKLSVPGYLESDGTFTNDGSHSNLVSQFHLPKIDRRMEAKGDFTVKKPKYSGVLSVCYDTKDPKKTFKIQTDSDVNIVDIVNLAFDTKNTISHADSVVQFNGKGKVKGTSVLNYVLDVDAEVVLPNGYNIGGKYHEKLSFNDKAKEVESYLELWDHPKGGEPQKLEVKIDAKNIDPKIQTFDGQASLSYTSRNKKNIHAHINTKKVPISKGASNVALEVGTSGSLIEIPVLLQFDLEVSNEYFDIDDSLSLEDDLPPLSFIVYGKVGDSSVNGVGKIGKPTTFELTGRFPENSVIKKFKLSSSTLIDLNDDDSKENRKVKLSNSLNWNDNRHVKLLLEGYCEENGGRYVAEYESDSVPKTRVTGSAHYSEGNNVKGDVSLAVVHDGKTAEVSVKGESDKDGKDTNLHIIANLDAAIEEGIFDIVFKNKIIKEGRGLNADLVVTQKGQKRITANSVVELDHDHPHFELNIECPKGKTRFLYKYDKKGDQHYKSELVATWPGKEEQFSLSADSEVNAASIDNLVAKGNVNAPQLLMAPIYLEIVNKPAKGEAKKLTFLYKEGDKVVASGSTNYNFKEEGDLSVLEGSGNIKYKDQSYPLNFQASRQLLTNGRVGKLSVKAGKMSLNVENKVTPEEFSMERTFCKEPKSCSKAQISSKVKSNLEHDEHKVIVYLDLSLLNPKLHDISYKYDYKRHNLVVDHNVEFQWANDAKLSSHAYIHDNSAGLYLNFPKRTIGGEVKYDTRSKDNKVQFRVETDFHINKGKEPKLSLIAGTTTVYDKGALTVAGEAKAVHPSLGKDLVAKGQLSISDKPNKFVEGLMEIDVSPDSSKKLIGKLKVSGSKDSAHTWATLTCTGCNIEITYEEKIKVVLNGKDSSYSYSESLSYLDSKKVKREFLAKFEASTKRIHAVTKFPETLLEVDIHTDKGYSGVLNVFGKKYRDTLTYNKDTNIVTYHLTGLADGKSLTVEAGGKIGGTGVFIASLGEKKACSLDVALDETNFLKSKYAIDKDVIKSIYSTLANEVKLIGQDCSNTVEALYERQAGELKRIVDCFDKAKPNVKPFFDHYKGQLQSIRSELENDKTLKDLFHNLGDSTGKIGEAVTDIFKHFVHLIEAYVKLAEEAFNTIKSSLHEIEPKVKASIQKIAKITNDLLEQYLKLSVQIFDWALEEVKKHQEDIDKFAKTFFDLLEDIGKQISQITITIHSQLDELVKHNLESFKELPIVASMEEKWAELKDVLVIPEEVQSLVHELIETLKTFLPTDESVKFVTTLEAVLEKILKHEEIKNRDEIAKQLYRELLAAIKSIIALLGQHAPQTGVLKPAKLQNLPGLHYLRLPSGTFKFSLLNLFTSKEYLPSISEILAGLRLSLNPFQNIPPYEGNAFVVGGTEIVTFDGVHLSIPADCSYILSEDYKDRNFSIVGQISKGAFVSITLSSKKDSIELRPNSNPLVNGKEHAFPAFAGELRAWRKPAAIGAWSDSGALVYCMADLTFCKFSVNGFYFGRVRGLLGNLNGEKYDERLLPEGKIVDDTGSLANAWKLHGSCSIPSTSDHKHVRDSQCTELFTEEPMALLCRPFVNPAPFRDACDHLAKSKKDGACLAAQAYTSACRDNGVLLAELPDSCTVCNINGKNIKAGETENSIQNKEADIVLLVDQAKENEQNYRQIAVPLVSALEKELHKAGVSDVKVVTIGATPLSEYASFLTNLKGEVSCDPSSNSIWFDERPVEHNETFVDRVRTARLKYEAELGRGRMLNAVFVNPYLFRPNSYRLVIGVFDEPCKLSFGSFVSALIKLVENELQGIQYTHISPAGGITKDGKDIEKPCVIGEEDAILSGGEEVKGTEYDGLDICVISTLASEGLVLSADEIIASPQRTKLINSAASKIVEKAAAEKKIFECECSLHKGVLPYPECQA